MSARIQLDSVYPTPTGPPGRRYRFGYHRLQGSLVRSQGQDVLALNAKRETGTNVIEVMDNFKTQIAKVNKDILAPRGWGLELFQVYHQTIYVRESVENARTDLLLDTAGWRRMNRPKPNPRSNQPQAAKQNPPLARTVTPSQA